MDEFLPILFTGSLVFSLFLYLGDRVPWFLGVVCGAMSSLFLFSAGFYWIGTSVYPEMGWLFILWGVVNLVLSLGITLSAFRGPKTRFDN